MKIITLREDDDPLFISFNLTANPELEVSFIYPLDIIQSIQVNETFLSQDHFIKLTYSNSNLKVSFK